MYLFSEESGERSYLGLTDRREEERSELGDSYEKDEVELYDVGEEYSDM